MKMIKAHQAIYDRYEQYLSDQNRKYALANVSYTSGRIYYKLGMYKESFQSYLKALGSNKLHIKVRTLVGFVLLFFKKLVPGS
jgi:tetratricopeptide (TPR) repeat protein